MEKKSAVTIVASIMFIIWIIIIKTVDVAKIGPQNTAVGLSHINSGIHELSGVNMVWYDITEVLGFLAIGVAGIFAVIGLVQLIKRKSLFKVDGEIIALGGLFVVVIGFYALFEKVIINYRPVIMEGSNEVEASFPSSHTMLICTVMGGVMIVIGKYIKDAKVANILRIVCGIMILITVCGRLVSGVHWFTDIVGGVFISVALVGAFSIIVERIKS
ncbi:MAG: phosphatase PAP2 family protein [Lachnospiraceae bacterium]|nr:phosphatase PAP2 family protein [Lachnospiraceae bacterium]